ncbi:MAG: type II secretion system protein [Planctomycetota bacterium]|jgi:prepilin-type N-terminal cleavage/methylation domain-containing protein/prepilin-type processing-associated H-X9-DG protein
MSGKILMERGVISVHRGKGFTLVELLVVIAIIALLMSILIPSLTRAKKQAKFVMCQSNLRQLGAALAMYTGDNDGYFQKGWGGGPADSFWWLEAVMPYYKNPDVCLCPMATRHGWNVGLGERGAKFYAWSANGWLYPPSAHGSYAINGWVEHRETEISGFEWMAPLRWRSINVKSAGIIPLMLDSGWIDGWPRHNDDPPIIDDASNYDDSHMVRYCINRHNEHINVLFLDFSVSKIPLKCLWRLKWERTFDLNYPLPVWESQARWMRKFKDCDR